MTVVTLETLKRNYLTMALCSFWIQIGATTSEPMILN